jgi:sarcosine oxidase subunit alpha
MAPLSMPLARTPLHHWHAARQAHFAESDGWQIVARYKEVARELAAVQLGLGLADISAFAKLSLHGPGVGDVLPALLREGAAVPVRGVGRLAADEAVLACRLTEEHVLLLASTTTPALSNHLANLPLNGTVVPSDITSAYAGFCLVGVQLQELLRRVSHFDVSPAALPLNACAETSLAGVPALLVHTDEWTLPSLRVYVAWDLGEDVWERLLDAGRNWGLVPLGLDGLRQLRRDTGAEKLL